MTSLREERQGGHCNYFLWIRLRSGSNLQRHASRRETAGAALLTVEMPMLSMYTGNQGWPYAHDHVQLLIAPPLPQHVVLHPASRVSTTPFLPRGVYHLPCPSHRDAHPKTVHQPVKKEKRRRGYLTQHLT